MVTEKNEDVEHDFFRDGIRLQRDGDWLKVRHSLSKKHKNGMHPASNDCPAYFQCARMHDEYCPRDLLHGKANTSPNCWLDSVSSCRISPALIYCRQEEQL